MWYREHDGQWMTRYEVRESKLMMYVSKGMKLAHDNMYGLYATRRYESEQLITVYGGDDIGAYNGDDDDHKGYRTMQAMADRRDGQGDDGNRGRHVMEVEGRLIDGYNGVTCAQYANAAYQVPSSIGVNKAEMLANGTIRVMKGKVINPGEEILFAYHSEYWRRWNPQQRQRGRPRKQAASTAMASASEAAVGAADGGVQCAERDVEVEWDEGGGIRHGVKPRTVSQGRVGRPVKRAAEQERPGVEPVQRRRLITQYRWSAVGRDEYSGHQRGVSRRYERGEGGGVT